MPQVPYGTAPPIPHPGYPSHPAAPPGLYHAPIPYFDPAAIGHYPYAQPYDAYQGQHVHPFFGFQNDPVPSANDDTARALEAATRALEEATRALEDARIETLEYRRAPGVGASQRFEVDAGLNTEVQNEHERHERDDDESVVGGLEVRGRRRRFSVGDVNAGVPSTSGSVMGARARARSVT